MTLATLPWKKKQHMQQQNQPGTGVRWMLLAEHQPTGNILSDPAWQHRWFLGDDSSDVVRSSNSTTKKDLLIIRTTVAGRITDGMQQSRASSFQPAWNLCSTIAVWSCIKDKYYGYYRGSTVTTTNHDNQRHILVKFIQHVVNLAIS